MLAWTVILPIVIGMVGLGVETGSWYLSKRNLQTAADTAALSGARETTTAKRTSAAQYSVTQNGFPSGSGVTVTVNNPPLAGGYTSDSNAVEVVLSKQQLLSFSSLFLGASTVVTARAVAVKQTAGSGSGCRP